MTDEPGERRRGAERRYRPPDGIRLIFFGILAMWLVFPILIRDNLAQDATPYVVAGELVRSQPDTIYADDATDLYDLDAPHLLADPVAEPRRPDDHARRLGLGWNYGHVSEVYAEMADAMPSLKWISWERIEREGSVIYPVSGEGQPGSEIVFTSGFPTADGRGRIVPADLLPPDEVPDADYPLVLTTGRLLEHWHTGSMTRRSATLDELEPEAIVGLNPREMGRLGINPGDMVRIETRRGEITLKARADRDVPEGLVFIPFCFAEAPANTLTNPQLDPMGKIPEFKFCACRITKLEMASAAE